mmetsp:Transcript_17301/g.43160  ORF Transcript_17301/g.43160 Transcript_17301/m.43160 type:complete len:93 (-) Transcript_17301:1572-1850(-)
MKSSNTRVSSQAPLPLPPRQSRFPEVLSKMLPATPPFATFTKGSLVPHHLFVNFLKSQNVLLSSPFSFSQSVVDPVSSANAPGLEINHIKAI